MTEKTVKIFPNMYFGLTHCYDEVPDNNDFKLHNHDDVYEIVLFLSLPYVLLRNRYHLRISHDAAD